LTTLRDIAKHYPPQQSFVISPNAAKFLESNPLAPLIAVICDQDIRAENAWEFPFWLSQQPGFHDFKASSIFKLSQAILRNTLQTYLVNKWPSGMFPDKQRKYLDNVSIYLFNACRLIADKFSDSPDNMFKLGIYSVPQLYFVLRSIPGFGPKKASMTARNFASGDDSWFTGLRKRLKENDGIILKVNLKHFSEVPVDIHAVKVFGRMMGDFKRIPPRTDFANYSSDIQNLAKIAFPDFPSKLDEILWSVGREYCIGIEPKCKDCPLSNLPCEYTS
jgi:endonuclease-3